MKIGLLLGSFDPIHIGHVHIATHVINEGICDKVLFVVAKKNPFKDYLPVPFDLRCEMVNVSIRGLENKCEVCTIESEIEGVSYSYKSLTMLREKYPNDELCVICGIDTFLQSNKWKNFDTHIKPYFSFIVLDRANMMWPPIDKEQEEKRPRATFIRQAPLPVSSSLIRMMLSEGKTPIPYINKETYDIILKNKLYGIQ